MRGQVNRSDIRVEREEVFSPACRDQNYTQAFYIASFEGHLKSGRGGRLMEEIVLSFTKPTYDDALNALMAEFEGLDIEVV